MNWQADNMTTLHGTDDKKSTLHNTLKKYISTQGGDPELNEWVLKGLEAEIIQEIISSKANEIAKVSVDIEQEKLQTLRRKEAARKLEEAKRVFFVVVILGLLVGLIGNQLTEMIGMLKNYLNEYWGITIGALFIFLSVTYIIFKSEYLAIASEMLEKFFQGE